MIKETKISNETNTINIPETKVPNETNIENTTETKILNETYIQNTLETKTRDELRKIASKFSIPNIGNTNKADLINNILLYQDGKIPDTNPPEITHKACIKCLEIFPINEFQSARICKTCYQKNRYCKHDKIKTSCIYCNGTKLCPHSKRKDRCSICSDKKN